MKIKSEGDIKMICDNKHCWRCRRYKKKFEQRTKSKWEDWGHLGNGLAIKIKGLDLSNIIASGTGGGSMKVIK